MSEGLPSILETRANNIPRLLDRDEQRPIVCITHYFKNNSDLQKTNRIITESGLYALILRSKLPSAEQFEKWVIQSAIALKLGRTAIV